MQGKNKLVNTNESVYAEYGFPAKGANDTLATLTDVNNAVATTRKTVANANYTILSTDKLVALTSITSSKVFTLPAANSLPAGSSIIVTDDSGQITSSITLTIQRAGTDTINGGTSEIISSAYGRRIFITDGTSKWNFDGGVVRLTVAQILSSKTFSDSPVIQKPIKTNAGTPTITPGNSAGTGATATLLKGDDICGCVQITTGTSPTVGDHIFTLTFSASLGSVPKAVLLTPANNNAGTHSGRWHSNDVAVTANLFICENQNTALSASTTYKWYYQVIL